MNQFRLPKLLKEPSLVQRRPGQDPRLTKHTSCQNYRVNYRVSTDVSSLAACYSGDINNMEKLMKPLITLLTILVLLVTIGCHPSSRGITGGGLRETVHMNRLSHTLVSADSGTDGVGAPSFDQGHSSWFN